MLFFGCSHNGHGQGELINIGLSNEVIPTTPRWEIAFYNHTDHSIYRLVESGTPQRLVTVESRFHAIEDFPAWPVWSPEGDRIAFNASIDGIPGIYIMNRDGSDLRRIYTSAGPKAEGVLEWDKTSGLLCVIKSIDGNAEIYAIRDTGEMQNLTHNPYWDFFPVPRSDGRIIFFSSREDSGRDTSDYDYKTAFVMNADGSGLERMFHLDQIDGETVRKYGLFPDISPRDDLMVLCLDGDIYLVRLDGRKLINITNTPDTWENYPRFSSEGDRILFSRVESGGVNLFLMDLDGTNMLPLTDTEDQVYLNARFRPMTTVTRSPGR